MESFGFNKMLLVSCSRNVKYIRNFMLVTNFQIKLKTFSQSLKSLFHVDELNLRYSISTLIPALADRALSGLDFGGI